MTDVTGPQPVAPTAPTALPALPAPSQRGRLLISPKAVEHIAAFTALEVPGVLEIGSGLESVIGRHYPKADANVAGEHVTIQLDLAVWWPSPLATTAQRVRALVRERIGLLAGLTVGAVHVTVARVEMDETPEKRRVQ